MKIKREMTIFRRKTFEFWIKFSFHLILLTISVDAIERKVICKKSSKDSKQPHINDVYYEFEANSANGDCDEESVSETAFALINDAIFPTSTLSGSLNDYMSETAQQQQQQHTSVATDSLNDFDDFSTRKPRSENTDEIVPTSILNFDPMNSPKTATSAEERQNNNPNADIQDIITGIVKLLNGNVNVHANTQFPPPSTRRFATRINNRGPPRISDLPPIILPIEEKYPGLQKTTPYPSGMRKPPTVPYPFDLPPPEKPLRNEHTILMHNKPIQPNRPPWHGSRTRPPIQITNTNRIQVPTRVSMNMPNIQPTQEFRLPSKSVNPMTTYSSRIPDLYLNEKPALNVMEQAITKPNQPNEQILKETTRKMDTTKKAATRIPSTTSSSSLLLSTTATTQMPIVESNKVVPEIAAAAAAAAATRTTTTTTTTTTTSTSTITSVEKSTTPTVIATEKTTESTPFTHTSQSLADLESTKTPELPQSTANKAHDLTSIEIKTTEIIQSSIKSTISPSRVSKPGQHIESTDFKSFYARPGIVLDDTDYTPGALEPSTKPNFHHAHRNTGAHSSATLSNIYAEIFDVTLSAIQGQPGHNKVVDLIEIGHSDSDATNVVPTKFYHGTDGNDIIVSASDDNSFVSIDGKRTYINLFGETAETEHLKKPLKTQNDHRIYQQSSKTVTPFAEKTNAIPMIRGKPSPANHPAANHTSSPHLPLSMRYNYRTKPQQNAVRIDTCIVGDDSTCDVAQNEICKTDAGVSSCHCRPGYSRRKYRDPCRRVVSLIMSMRVDKYYDKPIVWDKVFMDNNSEQFEHLSYEAMRAVDSVMSMTPFSDDFISARVHNIYTGNASQGAPGVFVNMTIQLDGNTESARSYIQSDLQKQLIAVIHRRNNNIGNSALYVDQPAGAISSLHDLDECSSAELNDCHVNANCSNTWGAFQCRCSAGLRDPWSDQIQRAGRECISCANSYCNNRGTCQYDDSGTQLVCVCSNSYYGSQCEIDGDILAVSVGASIIAVLIITLTLVCLVMWGRRWNQEQKEIIGSPIFNYITRANLDTHMKTMQSKTYQAALEDRMRWAQIADVMAQSNHYAVEPVAPQRVQPAPMYVYQNMHHPNSTANLTSLSMAGTLPVRNRGMSELSIPVSRMGLEATSKMRRHDHTSSSEEDDLVDLLGSTYQSPTGIYYDVDCESSDQQHGTSTLQSNLDNGGPLYSLSNVSNAPRVPMTTYTPKPRVYPRN